MKPVTIQQVMKFLSFKEGLLEYIQNPAVPKFLVTVCNVLVYTVCSCQPAAKTSKLEDHFFRPSATYLCTSFHRYSLYVGPSVQPAKSWSAMAWLGGTLMVVHTPINFGKITQIILRFLTTRYDSPYVIVFTFQAKYMQSLQSMLTQSSEASNLSR